VSRCERKEGCLGVRKEGCLGWRRKGGRKEGCLARLGVMKGV
jgi:hypothetical protein